MMSLLLLLMPFRRWLAGSLLALVLTASAFAYGHHRGAVATEAKWQAAMAAEETRQAAVRAKALDQAVSRELARTATDNALQQQVTDYEEKLAKNASSSQPSGAPKVCHRLSATDVGELRQLQSGDPH